MTKKLALTFALILSTLGASAGPAAATATDGTINWRIWGYVSVWRTQPDGNTMVGFKDSAGNALRSWPNGSGTEICGGTAYIYLSKAHAGFTEMNRIITTAGLTGKTVKIGYEAVGTTCYLKELLIQM